MKEIISKLPEYIIYEIITYIIGSTDNIIFLKIPNEVVYNYHRNYSIEGYSDKYESGYYVYRNIINNNIYEKKIKKNNKLYYKNGDKYIIYISL